MPSSRLVGIDIARALAIAGMFIAHLAVDARWTIIADGRPSSLFAVLAGCGLGFISRSRQIPRMHIILRAMWLALAGVLLMLLGTPIAIILSSYGLLFVLMLPFLQMSPRQLLVWAGIVIVAAPPIVAGVRVLVNGYPGPGMWIPGLAEFATGYYPALSWLAYPLVGLAILRLPIRTLSVQVYLLAAGVALAVLGYGAGVVAERAAGHGSTYLRALVSAQPHSDSAPEIVGNIGVALAVVAVCLLVTRTRVGTVLFHPLAVAGAMSLTLYVGHLFVIAILGEQAVLNPGSNWPLVWLIVGSIGFAMTWHRFFTRGPLEWALFRLSTPREDPSLVASSVR